jgi:UDP-N-acetylmuramoyl-tripeptide--D-alanyl-D-alanine ligase
MRAGDKRGEVLEWRGAVLINDCYNSNPTALNAMVDALMAIPGERHVVVAGEMLELGPEAEALHAACGQRMAERGVDFVLGVRGMAEAIVAVAKEAGVEGTFVTIPEEAGEWLVANVRAGDVVLLKASRGVRLERALTMIAQSPQ